ncbi:AraC family transcriptional regulator [Pontibacterium sp. N1Y112]|uniref:AraC family transcriptional regulator n=1 Tax=Pontibacterium sinense TaxID=2781979 RepID=A0A8J7FU45_9GAMM|nr:helix-turn-helix domain-containing protein [Pontibacterium sinense]MBE9399537.1 AraC family transcriptional regulator [Pontibacterium sinense]
MSVDARLASPIESHKTMGNTVATLSHINLTLHKPAAALHPFVKDYWFISGTAGTSPKTEYLPADTGCGITFNFGDSILMGETLTNQCCVVNGPNTRSMPLHLGSHVDALGIRFHPGMGYPFFQQPLTDFPEPIEPHSQLTLRLTLNHIYDQLAKAQHPSERTLLLDDWLLHHLTHSLSIQPDLTAALNWLEQQPQDPIANLPHHVDLGQRQLERVFKQWVGISPKQYHRIVRINTVRSSLRNQSHDIRLSDEAINAGYFDQAHMSREFKRVVGLTPGQYLKCLSKNETAPR